MEVRNKGHNISQVLKEEPSQPRFLHPVKTFFRDEEKSGHSQIKETEKSCHQQTDPKRVAKECSLNRKKMIKKEFWNIRKEERTMRRLKI